MSDRPCSKPSCGNEAISTLTFIYKDSTAVLGPLGTYAEPNCYDLCEAHTKKLTVANGWEVIRLQTEVSEQTPNFDNPPNLRLVQNLDQN